MSKIVKKINPEVLRVPTKAYSQAVQVDFGVAKLLFITGQLPQDIDGEIVAPGDMQKQAEVVFSRLETILNEARMSFDDVVKMQIFVKDIKQAKIVSNLRDKHMKNSCPASTLVEVSGFVKEGCMLEIEMTATSSS